MEGCWGCLRGCLVGNSMGAQPTNLVPLCTSKSDSFYNEEFEYLYISDDDKRTKRQEWCTVSFNSIRFVYCKWVTTYWSSISTNQCPCTTYDVQCFLKKNLMTLDSDRIHWHGGGGREDSVLGTWIDSLCIDISKLSLSSRGITASRMAISKGWYVVAVGHTIQCDSVTVIHKYKFQCFGAAEGPGQTSRTRRPFLLSDSMSVRMDTEEVYSMSSSMWYQLTAATGINTRAWSTISGATWINGDNSRDSAGEENEHSEENYSIVHWRDDVAVFV